MSSFSFVSFTSLRANAIPWTPTSLGASLALWLDASDATTVTATSPGGLVSEWRDKSGNGRHAVQTSSGSQPQVVGSAIAFDSSNKFMTGPKPADTLPTSVQVTVVFSKSGDGKNGYLSHPFTLTTGHLPTPFDGYNGSLLVGGPTGSYAGFDGFTDIRTLTTRNVLSTSMSASKVEQFLNGTLVKSSTGVFPYRDVPSIYYIATRGDRFTHFTGEINEIVVTNELSSVDRVNLESYLGAKWAVGAVPTTTSTSTTSTTTTSTTTTSTTTSTTSTTTIPRTTTSTNASSTTSPGRVVEIEIQAPVATVAMGQASVATIAPGTQSNYSTRSQTSTTTTTTTTSSTIPESGAPTTTIANTAQSVTKAPAIPKLGAGEGAVDIGGKIVKQNLTRKNNQLQIQSGSLSATLSSTTAGGNTAPLDKDGNLRLSSGDIIKISVGGFKPGSEVTAWFFSTPIKLGTATVKPDGTVTASLRVPQGVEDGAHRVAIVAELTNGKPATFSLAVVVGEIARTSTFTRMLIVVPIMLAVFVGLLLPNRMRRRRAVQGD